MATRVIIRPETWLETVFATSLQVRLLRLLHRDSKKYWTEREAARAIGSPAPSARKVFRRLESLGLLEIRQAGRTHLVRPRQDLVINERIRFVFQMESSTLAEIWRAVKAGLPSAVSCYVFGSTARGTAGPASDLDLLVSGRDRNQAQAAAEAVRRAIRSYAPTPTNVVALSHKELGKRRYRRLAANIKREGQRLAGPDLAGVIP